MEPKNTDNIVKVITSVAETHGIVLQTGDMQAFAKAYLKFGDIDLALNEDGQVLSDLMEAEDLDIIAYALKEEFGKAEQSYPEQTYPVKINDRVYQTTVDGHGDQRFKGNRILEQLASSDSDIYTKAEAAYRNGEYSVDEWTEFNALLGSKVKTFMLGLQTNVKFENSREENL